MLHMGHCTLQKVNSWKPEVSSSCQRCNSGDEESHFHWFIGCPMNQRAKDLLVTQLKSIYGEVPIDKAILFTLMHLGFEQPELGDQLINEYLVAIYFNRMKRLTEGLLEDPLIAYRQQSISLLES